MLLIPYTTTCYNEAPPWGTRLILALNIAVFGAVCLGAMEPEAWVLDWQDPFNPSLIGSAFLHLDWIHLILNLILLWVLGRIVEGTIGTRSFLLLTLGIILGANSLEAVVFYGQEGGSLGASGAVFGLLAAAFLIAPRSKVHCYLHLLVRPSLIKMPLVGFAALTLGLEVTNAAFAGFEPSSALLHVAGAGIGAMLAYMGLKRGWLDAGGWDWLSLRKREDRKQVEALAEIGRKRDSNAARCFSCGRVRPPKATRCVYCGSKW